MKLPLIFWSLACGFCCTALHAQSFDIVLTNGRVVDGTGVPWYVADVGIRDGRIANIGRLGDAKATRKIDPERRD